jgi:glycosyltransferase involved in cell wall biosynthesis
LVVCDDGSGPEPRALIEQWAGRASFPIIHAWQEDKGFRKGRALNLSLARSQADYVVLLDGDCIPSHRFVEDHVRLAEPGYFVQGRRAFIAEQAVPDYLDGKVGLVSLALAPSRHQGQPRDARHHRVQPRHLAPGLRGDQRL